MMTKAEWQAAGKLGISSAFLRSVGLFVTSLHRHASRFHTISV